LTRYYVCTLTLAVPEDGLPAITASAWRPAAKHEAGTSGGRGKGEGGRVGTGTDTLPPTPDTLPPEAAGAKGGVAIACYRDGRGCQTVALPPSAPAPAEASAPDSGRPLTALNRERLRRMAAKCGEMGQSWLPAIEKAVSRADGEILFTGLLELRGRQERGEV
jgi:hypothetical protein